MATAATASTASTGHISLDAALRYRRDATELLKTPPAKTGDTAADEAAALSHTRKALQWFQLGRQNCMETINSLRQEKQLRDEEEAQKKKAADAEAAKVAAAKAAAAPPPQRPAAAAVAPPPPAVPRGPSLSAPSLSAPSMASRYGSSSGASSKSADLSSGLGLPQLMPTLSDPAPVTATPSATVEPPQASPLPPPPPAAPVAVPAAATASVASVASEEAPAKTENDAMMKLFNSGGQKGLSGEHRALALDNFLACTSNATMLLLKLNKFSDAVRLANEVLEFDPKNAKALYRKGVATVSMGSADEGLKFLRLALEQAPGDGGIIAAIENAQQQVVQQDQRAKATYAKMLSGASR